MITDNLAETRLGELRAITRSRVLSHVYTRYCCSVTIHTITSFFNCIIWYTRKYSCVHTIILFILSDAAVRCSYFMLLLLLTTSSVTVVYSSSIALYVQCHSIMARNDCTAWHMQPHHQTCNLLSLFIFCRLNERQLSTKRLRCCPNDPRRTQRTCVLNSIVWRTYSYTYGLTLVYIGCSLFHGPKYKTVCTWILSPKAVYIWLHCAINSSC